MFNILKKIKYSILFLILSFACLFVRKELRPLIMDTYLDMLMNFGEHVKMGKTYGVLISGWTLDESKDAVVEEMITAAQKAVRSVRSKYE